MTATRALLWKEWRSLRGIRWAGMGLGAILPVAFLIGAQAASRGSGVFARAASWSPHTLFFELLPATLALAIWPLVALLATAQSYAGDRAAGTETFLLERPIGRGRVWWARLAAAGGSTLVVIVGTALLATSLAAASASAGAEGWRRTALAFATGAALALVVLLCGTAAGTMIKQPLSAVLLGGVLAGFPVLLAWQLAARFPLASLGPVPLALIWPWLLIPAYAVASFRGAARGEPLGTGAARRIGETVAIAIAVVVAGFFVSTPIAMRFSAMRDVPNVESPSRGGAVFVSSSGYGWMTSGSWIVEPGSGRRVKFMPPSNRQAEWNSDGTLLAVETNAGSFGSRTEELRVEFRRPDGTEAYPPVRLPDDESIWRCAWCGDRLATFLLSKGGVVELTFLDPPTGSLRRTGWRAQGWMVSFVRPVGSRDLFVALLDADPRSKGDAPALPNDREYPLTISRIDPQRGVVPEPLLRDANGGSPYGAGNRLSPSARYWIRQRKVDGLPSRELLDLQSGQATVGPRPSRFSVWLAGDRLAWVEAQGERRRLFVARPGEAAKPLREWKGNLVNLWPSPDGKALLLQERVRPGNDPTGPPEAPSSADWTTEVPRGREVGHDVYLVDEDRWIDGPEWGGFDPNPFAYPVGWAGPRTLALSGPGVLAFEEVGKPDSRRFAWGKAPRAKETGR